MCAYSESGVDNGARPCTGEACSAFGRVYLLEAGDESKFSGHSLTSGELARRDS